MKRPSILHPGTRRRRGRGRGRTRRWGAPWRSLLAALVVAAGGACVVQAAPLEDEVARHAPSVRFGTLPTPHTLPGLRNAVVDADDLGLHGYRLHHLESTGIVYTCRAGFLDLDHVRDAADRTAWMRQRFVEALLEGREEVRIPGEDRAVSIRVRLRPLDPADRAAWAGPVATELARRYAFLLMTWHEVLTWYGYRETWVFSEKVSAFSYEDTVSHLVGLEVASRALASAAPWDEAVDRALPDVLHALGAVPRDVTWQAFDRVSGRWFDPVLAWPLNGFVKKRDLDIGLDGKGVRPWRAEGVAGCEDRVDGVDGVDGRDAPLAIDQLDTVAGGRFAGIDTARLSPGGRAFWSRLFPAGRPLEDGRPIDALDPRVHLGLVMEQVRRDVRAALGEDADRP